MTRLRMSRVHRLAMGLGIAATLTGAGAQQNIPKGVLKDAAQIHPPVVNLPSSVDKTKAASPVLVIPEAEIVKGIDLTPAQHEALTRNLKSARFQAVSSHTINPHDLAAQRLPTGQLVQMMQMSPTPAMTMQYTPTGLGGLADPCQLADYTDKQVAALHALLVTQLKAKNFNTGDFESHTPKDCRRQQMIYYMEAAALLAP